MCAIGTGITPSIYISSLIILLALRLSQIWPVGEKSGLGDVSHFLDCPEDCMYLKGVPDLAWTRGHGGFDAVVMGIN